MQPTKALGFLGDYMGLTNVGEDFLALFSQPPTEAGTRRSNEEVGERVGQESVAIDLKQLLSPEDSSKAFLPRRWVVERTFSWLG